MSEPRPVFVITLRAEKHITDPIRAMRQLLKIALRRVGLRCISVEQVSQPVVQP